MLRPPLSERPLGLQHPLPLTSASLRSILLEVSSQTAVHTSSTPRPALAAASSRCFLRRANLSQAARHPLLCPPALQHQDLRCPPSMGSPPSCTCPTAPDWSDATSTHQLKICSPTDSGAPWLPLHHNATPPHLHHLAVHLVFTLLAAQPFSTSPALGSPSRPSRFTSPSTTTSLALVFVAFQRAEHTRASLSLVLCLSHSRHELMSLSQSPGI